MELELELLAQQHFTPPPAAVGFFFYKCAIYFLPFSGFRKGKAATGSLHSRVCVSGAGLTSSASAHRFLVEPSFATCAFAGHIWNLNGSFQ